MNFVDVIVVVAVAIEYVLDLICMFLMHFLFLNRIETITFEIVSMAEPST